MPRNLDTRVELLAPVEDQELQAELQDTLERCLADDTFAWTLGPDGQLDRRRPGERARVHRELMERTLAQGREREQLAPPPGQAVGGDRCTATFCS